MGERNRDGRFTPEHSDADVLAAVRTHQPAATSEVADELGMTRQGADRRLRQLRGEGRVNSKKIAASLVWFPVDDVEQGAARDGRERIETAPEPAADVSPSEDPADATPPEQPEGTAGFETINFPTTVDREDAEAAIHAARDYLREEGPASMREIVTSVMPEHSLGYQVPELEPGDRYRGSWWRKVVQPGLESLDDIEYRENYSDYRFIGDRDEGESNIYDPTEEF